MGKQTPKTFGDYLVLTEKTRWTWRRMLRTALLMYPALFTVLVADTERKWDAEYADEASRRPLRRQARLWAGTWSVFYAAAVCVVWYFASMTSLLFRNTLHFQVGHLPHPTEWMLFVGSHGWLLLLPIPLIGWGLARLRMRGGVHSWYAEIACGTLFVALVFLAGAICCGAAVPFIDWSAQYRLN